MKLAWLAGIVDGEGTITLCRITNGRGFTHIRPIFQVVNTNYAMLVECRSILHDLGVIARINTKSFGKDGKRSHWKDSYQIQIVKHESVRVICEALIPYLITKKLQAELVVKFVSIRQSVKRGKMTGVKGGQNKPYGNGEEALYLACKQLNKESSNNQESVETIRQTLLVNSKDIVRPVDIDKTTELPRNRVAPYLSSKE